MIITCKRAYSPSKMPSHQVLLQPGHFLADASNVPAGASGSRHKLQIEIFAQFSFHGVCDLPVQPSLQPEESMGTGHQNPGCGGCEFYEGCSLKPCFRFSQGQVCLQMFQRLVPDRFVLSCRV